MFASGGSGRKHERDVPEWREVFASECPVLLFQASACLTLSSPLLHRFQDVYFDLKGLGVMVRDLLFIFDGGV